MNVRASWFPRLGARGWVRLDSSTVMFRNVERPLEARWPCTLPRLLAEMARTIDPRQKDGATTAAGLERVSRSLIHSYDGAYATHLLVVELDGV